MTADQLARFAIIGRQAKIAVSGVEIKIHHSPPVTVMGTVGVREASLELVDGGFDDAGTLAAYIPAATVIAIGDRITTGGASYIVATVGHPGPAERRITLRPNRQ
jgi:hypothetical protein